MMIENLDSVKRLHPYNLSTTGIRTLSDTDVDEVSGAFAPLVIAWGIGFLAGMAYGTYLQNDD